MVLAAWILAWNAAPFAGWDILFYVLLLAFLAASYASGIIAVSPISSC